MVDSPLPAEAAVPSRSGSRWPLVAIYAITFIAFTDTFALIPTIGPYAEALGATGLGMGLAVGAYSATDIIFNVVGGVMLDRTGRKRLAMLGFAMVSLAAFLYPLADDVTSLVAVRLFHGAGGGILIPAIYTLIGDLSRSGGRGRAMGRVGAVIGSVAVVVPGIAGAVRERSGFDPVFIGLGVVLLLGLVITAVSVRETLGTREREQARMVSIRSLLGIHELQVACIGVFGFTAGFGSLAAFLSTRVEDMGYSPRLSGGMYTLLALVAAVLMLSRVAGRVDYQGPRRPVLVGLPSVIAGLIVIGLAEGIGLISVGMVLFGIGFGIVYPAVSGATAAAAAAPGRGRAFGVFSVAYSIGFVVGPPLAGFLSDQAGISPFFTAAAISAGTLVIVALLRERGGKY